MMKSIWAQLRNEEDGMSVLEIVVAAFILFFVFTAMLGLVGTTTKMGQNAKARVAMTNAVSSHMEWVRSLTFDEVDIVGSTPEGVVQPTYTYTVDGYTVTIQNQISSGQDDTKELQITASATAPNFNGITMTSFTAIRDDSGLSLFSLDDADADAPVVTFSGMTPDADEVLYRSFILGGSSLFVEATAEAQVDGGYIAEIRYFCQGELLRNGSTIFADVAEWTPGITPVSEMFGWDTTQVDEAGTPIIDDGWRLVYIIATDNEGNEGRAERRFYVDNYKPDMPENMVSEVKDDIETRLSWGVAMDGTDAAEKYEVWTGEYGVSGTIETSSSAIITDPAYIHQANGPFSRYSAKVKAGSPRNLWSDQALLDEPFTTRPGADGSSTTWYEGRNNRRRSFTHVYVHVDEPRFGYSSIRYDVYRSVDPSNMGDAPYQTDTGPLFDELESMAVGRIGVPDQYYYQFKVTYVALGTGGGQTEEIWSNVIGPTTVNQATEQMVHVTW